VWFASWCTIQQVNKSDKKYTLVVKDAAEHQKYIGEPIKQAGKKPGATRGARKAGTLSEPRQWTIEALIVV